MTRRLAIGVLLGLAAILLLASLLLAWALATHSGSRALWNAASGAVEGLDAEAVEGRLIGPLSVRGLRFESEFLRLRVGALTLDWSPGALWRGDLRIDRLHVSGVTYTQLATPPPPPGDSEPFALPDAVTLPVDVELHDIALRAFQYRSAPEAEPLVVDSAELAASLRGHELAISRLAAEGPLFTVRTQASARTRGDYPARAAVDWEARPPGMAPVAGTLTLEGGLSALRITQRVQPPYGQTQVVQVRDLLGDLQFDARVDLEKIHLQDIDPDLPPATLSGRLRAGGAPADLDYDLALAATAPEVGDITLHSHGGFTGQVLALEHLRLALAGGSASSESTASLQAAGRVELSGAAPRMDLRAQWEALRWPLQGEPRLTSPRGTISLQGSLADYTTELAAGLAVPGQGDGRLQLAGSGSGEAFDLTRLQLDLLDGTLSGHGKVRWSPALQGSLTLSGQGLDPGLLAADYPGDLGLELRASGGLSDDTLRANIDRLHVAGTLRERPLALQLQADVAGSRVQLQQLALEAGSTRIDASGALGADALDLDWAIDSPDLQHLLPGAGGALRGSGRVGGSPSLPAVRGTLQGQAMHYAQYHLDRLALDLDVDLQRPAPSRFELALERARVGDFEINRVALSGAGTRGDHRLQLQADTADGAARLDLAGDWQDDHWAVSLTDGRLQYGELAPWTLAAPQAGRVTADAQQLERGCWRSGEAQLCLQGGHAAGDLEGALALQALPLSYLRPMLPDTLSLAGQVSAQARFQQPAGATPALELKVDTGAIDLRTGPSAQQPDAPLLGIEPSSLSVDYRDTGLAARVAMPLAGNGGISGELQVEDGSAPLAERPLGGRLQLAVDDIGFLTALSPDIEAAAGALAGHVDLSGSLAQPTPAGELSLRDGALQLATPGLAISDIGLRVRSTGPARLAIEGGAASGGGRLQLGGDVRLDGAQSEADITIEGTDFQVVDTADARAFVSPDLRVALTPDAIRVTGEVTVPRAKITPKKLPASAVTASSDQVIVSGDAGEEGAAATQRGLEANIRIVLGDAVSVDGFGFTGRLAGSLAVEQMPGRPTLGSGELNILDGEYRAYGQGLVIERGKILFAGGPIDQPGIDVRAVRRPAEDILVGVQVRGSMQEPDFTVFSEPAMTQSEQLSWLVLGRSLQGASEGESDMIAQAAMALGVKGGNFLADRLGGDLGVDTLGIETGSGEAGAASDVNQAAFVIGKYLSPDLFVSYGIGLFESVSTVKLEYSLDENWKLSTESSTLSSGGDVIYTIER